MFKALQVKNGLQSFSLSKKYIIEKSCTELKFTSTLFKGWQGLRGQRPIVAGQFDL